MSKVVCGSSVLCGRCSRTVLPGNFSEQNKIRWVPSCLVLTPFAAAAKEASLLVSPVRALYSHRTPLAFTGVDKNTAP